MLFVINTFRNNCNYFVKQNRKLKSISDIPSGQDLRSVYCQIASRVHSVLPFVKVAYPDMVGSGSTTQPEQLNLKDRKTCRYLTFTTQFYKNT